MANSLVSLLGRLETAVARLEGAIGGPSTGIPQAPVLGSIPPAPVLGSIPAAPVLAAVPGQAPATAPAPKPVSRDSPLITAFETLVVSKFPALETAGQVLGGTIAEATAAYIEGMRLSGQLLRLSETCHKPTAEELKTEVYPKLQECMGKVDRLKDKHKQDYNHIAAVSEGIRATQWPVVVLFT